MTIHKRYAVKDEDTIDVVYLVEVELNIGDGDTSLNDVIDYPINSEEDLTAISDFEEEAKKREEVLTEKAMKLKKIADKLNSMGYIMVEEEVEEVNGKTIQKFYE